MKSVAFDVTTVVKALMEAEGFIHQIQEKERGYTSRLPLSWQPNGSNIESQFVQYDFVKRLGGVRSELAEFTELNAWARWSAEEINKILEDHGFSIRLQPWKEDPHHFGVAAIYDLSIKWLVKGEVERYGQPFLVNGKPAFRLDWQAGIEFYETGFGYPLIRIPGENPGDYVCLTRVQLYVQDSLRMDWFYWLSMVENFRRIQWNLPRDDRWNGLVMPNLLLDKDVDISWLVGLWSVDEFSEIWEVAQAKMQAKFALGPEGARAKVAAAIGVLRSFNAVQPKPDYVVDHDILLWIERESIKSEPLFTAYIPKEEFADHTVELTEI